MSARWHEKYLGIPFKIKGRDFDGCDCAGLILLVLRSELGINAFDQEDVYSRKELATREGEAKLEALVAASLSEWKAVDVNSVKPFDLLLYEHRGARCHCGIVVDEKFMMHVETHHAAHLDKHEVNGYKLVGAYRHERLC